MKFALIVCLALSGFAACKQEKSSMKPTDSPPTDTAATAAARVRPALERDLAAVGLKFGDPVFIRAFKEELQLELFVLNRKTGKYDLFRTWPIAKASGTIGPKLAEGDGQVPEGFYHVPPSAMNPNSRFHLAFNIGYPNEYDRLLGHTGSAIMIHGNQVSVGCLAMTDEKIEEIYTLCSAAHTGGQTSFPVHIFPFRMTDDRLKKAEASYWLDFWKNLKEGYDAFEKSHIPPSVSAKKGHYLFH